MEKMQIMNGLAKQANKVIFQLKKHSPEILIVAGVIGTVTSAVMACTATTKLSHILDDAKTAIDAIHDAEANQSLADVYSKEDAKKDLTITYLQTGVKLVKLYAPSVALGVLSLTGIVASNNMLRKRNIALAAAYTAVDMGFKDYRNRVVERFGDNVDKELRHNIKVETINTTVDGEEETHSDANVIQSSQFGDYTFFFEDPNPYWEKDGSYNRMFLLAQQQFANDKLRADGYIFLNDVLVSIGIPRTKAGQIDGWVYNPNNPIGGNRVDFGIYEAYRKAERSFVKDKALGDRVGDDKYEPVVILDFNVDGNIWELMKR